jgi:hypothetical protein
MTIDTAKPVIFEKMVAILQDIEAIGKNSKNEQQGFKYRGIDDVYNAVNPLLAKHGVFMSAQILDKSREERTTSKGAVLAFTSLRMRYRFTASDGSFVETEVEGEGMDSGDKSSNKAMSVAHKYALLQAFCIPTRDLDDPDAETHEVQGRGKPQSTRPTSPATNPQEPTKERQQAAANWCFEAKGHVQSLANGAALETWVCKSSRAMDTARSLVPNAHKALCDTIEQQRRHFNPIAAE